MSDTLIRIRCLAIAANIGGSKSHYRLWSRGTEVASHIECAMNSGTRADSLWRLMPAIAAALLAMFSDISFLAREASAHEKTDTLRNQLSQIVKRGPPGALLLLQDGKLRQRLSVGLADLATQRRATTDDAWRIASVTKLVTAAIIIQLVQERHIKLDDRLSAYLPNSVRLAESITIRQLLNHTSGIPDYLSAPHVPLQVSAKHLKANLIRQRSTRGLLSDARSQRRRFKPGSMHEYSNTNYLLLGLIIEKVTGKKFQTVVRDRIIVPLKLKRTGFPDASGNIRPQHMRGYVPGDLRGKPFSNRRSLIDVTAHDYFLGGDGGLYSTLDETASIVRYVLSGQGMDRSVQRAMVSSMVQDHDGFYRYGLGVMAIELPCGQRVFGHEGRDLGIYTMALFDLKHGRSLVVAANMSFEHQWGIQDRIDEIRNMVFCGPYANCRKHQH